ncbi:hypothetical protein SAMN04488077_12021 [Roseovarius tolerans]|uniref:Uncharacterized protein n=1 Tax=Roseovarius tolerans TaxID=74031 RepID=A0A1H8HFA1_9RHOB|nr:hypothetical protein [Roseovarius tolerans]SEN54853.1 hypothetical protein SAMN04488077_12021 [Roseovarius tolerans]
MKNFMASSGVTCALTAVAFAVIPAWSLAAEKLNANQVLETFVGTPWHSKSGAFLFQKNGQYTYQRFGTSEPAGVWEYQLASDGTVSGRSTDYKFYRRDDGSYFYFHSRTNKNYNAYPNKSFP